MIRVVGKRGKGSFESQLDEAEKGKEFVRIDCTSGNPDPVMRMAFSPSDRTLLRVASQKENIYARGFSVAGWKRLPMAEKFAILRGAR